MNEPPALLHTVQEFIDKWPTEKDAQIQDSILREMIVDLVNVVGQVEMEAEDAAHQAERARSRATWGLLGGWG